MWKVFLQLIVPTNKITLTMKQLGELINRFYLNERNVAETERIYRRNQRQRSDPCSARSVRKCRKRNWRNWMHLLSSSIKLTICCFNLLLNWIIQLHCRCPAYCKKYCSKFRITQNRSAQSSALCPANVSLSISTSSVVATWRRAITCGLCKFFP